MFDTADLLIYSNKPLLWTIISQVEIETYAFDKKYKYIEIHSPDLYYKRDR